MPANVAHSSPGTKFVQAALRYKEAYTNAPHGQRPFIMTQLVNYLDILIISPSCLEPTSIACQTCSQSQPSNCCVRCCGTTSHALDVRLFHNICESKNHANTQVITQQFISIQNAIKHLLQFVTDDNNQQKLQSAHVFLDLSLRLP